MRKIILHTQHSGTKGAAPLLLPAGLLGIRILIHLSNLVSTPRGAKTVNMGEHTVLGILAKQILLLHTRSLPIFFLDRGLMISTSLHLLFKPALQHFLALMEHIPLAKDIQRWSILDPNLPALALGALMTLSI